MNVVITGAGRGLGQEFARQYVRQGHRVFGTVRSSAAPVERIGAEALTLDVGDTSSILAFSHELSRRVERVDLLINNAGINSRGVPDGQGNVRWGSLEPQGILKMVHINAIGPILVTQAVDDLLGEGSIVLSISSWLGSIGGKTSGGNYGYCASKTTLNMLNRAMAFDLQPRGITCVVANPGWVQTDMGGNKARLTAEQSVAGLREVVAGLSVEDAGRFFDHDGDEHAW